METASCASFLLWFLASYVGRGWTLWPYSPEAVPEALFVAICPCKGSRLGDNGDLPGGKLFVAMWFW